MMTNEILIEIACPNCRHPIDVRKHGRHATCEACSSQFILSGHFCPGCYAYHQEEQAFCGECGQPMTRRCQKCHTVNWAGDEYCKQCGAALDIFQLLHLHANHTTQDRLQQQMKAAQYYKEKEKADSERRMADMMALEQERRREVARRALKRRQQDKAMLTSAAIILSILVLIVILFTLF